MTTDVKYDLIPEHMRRSLRRYIEQGAPVGDFLFAVLSNKLADAYGKADEVNTAAMFQWVQWLWMECPSPAWGSPEKVLAWQLRQRGRKEEVAK